MPRIYERKFDWDEARRLRREGLGWKAIADQMGVTPTAIRYALVPSVRARMDAQAAAWQRRGTCSECKCLVLVRPTET